MKIIGIGHKARQGKNAFASMLVIEAGKRTLYAKQYGFADALKATCRVLGMKDKNPRALQAFGTDVMRQFDEDIWVNCLMRTMQEDNPDIAIVTDVRFHNEAAALKNNYATLVRLDRYTNDKNPTRYVADDRDPNHPSEIDLDDFEWELLIEHQTLVDLNRAAVSLIARI